MKKLLSIALLSSAVLMNIAACAQASKGDRPSPPAKATEKISSGATVTIEYSQPALKGRTIGKDVEPKDGQVWRAGANEATVFQVDKDVTINGKALPAGKYAFFTLSNGDKYTLIFNKVWNTWGAYDYAKNKGEDALTVDVTAGKTSAPVERLTYTVDKSGLVSLTWGTLKVDFTVM